MDLIGTYDVEVDGIGAAGNSHPPLDQADQISMGRLRLVELGTAENRQQQPSANADALLSALRDNTSFENVIVGSKILAWSAAPDKLPQFAVLLSRWDKEEHHWSAALLLGDLRKQVPIPPGEVTVDDLSPGERKHWPESEQLEAVAYLNSSEGAAYTPTRSVPALPGEQLDRMAADLQEAALALGRPARATLFLPGEFAPLFPFFPLIFPGRVSTQIPGDPDFAVVVGCDSGDVAPADSVPETIRFSIGVETHMKLAWLDPEDGEDGDEEGDGMKGRHDIQRTCYVSEDHGGGVRVVFNKPLALMAYTKGANSCGSKVWLAASTVPLTPGGSVMHSPKTSLSKLLHLDAGLSALSYRLDDHNYLGNEPSAHATVSYTIYLLWGVRLGPVFSDDQLYYKFDELAHFFQNAVHSPDTSNGRGMMLASAQAFRATAKKQRLQ